MSLEGFCLRQPAGRSTGTEDRFLFQQRTMLRPAASRRVIGLLPPLAHQSCMLPQPRRALGTINSVRLQEREFISIEADLLCWSHLRITAALADLSNI